MRRVMRVAPPWASERWKNRRWMAWGSFACMSFLMLGLLFIPESRLSNERIKVLNEPIVWYFTISGTIIGAYVGFASWVDVKSRSRRLDEDGVEHSDEEEK